MEKGPELKRSKIQDILTSIGIVSMGAAVFILSYMPINHFNQSRDFYYELFFSWELSWPLWDWMLIPYVSAYLMPIIPIFKLNRKEQLALLYSIIFCCSIGLLIFYVFPTKLGFVRGDGVSEAWLPLYKILWDLDPPHNLFPSQHVILAYLLTIPALKKFQRWEARAVILFWFVLVCSSIIFTHQHHLLDLVAGLEIAWMAHLLIFRVFSGNKAKSQFDDLKIINSKDSARNKISDYDDVA
jgi:membrane-associated phospholipid phosphatase